MGAGKAKAYVCVYVHEGVNAHLWSSTLIPSQQPSREVELGDQRPGLVRVNFEFLQFTYWCFVGIGVGLDESDLDCLR